jgi:sulfatase maturation enzyme AslB (radical SAM superfamily)
VLSEEKLRTPAGGRLVVLKPAGPSRRALQVVPPLPSREPAILPEPVFPIHPEKCGDVAPDSRSMPRNGSPYRTRVTPFMIRRAMRGWLYPYLRSRVYPGDFHPIIAYLFTELKCNLDCHYCWAFDNTVKGMTEDTARRSIDWLHDTGCRVLALMGGEVFSGRHSRIGWPITRPNGASGCTCRRTAA